MITNYIKTSLRNLFANKTISFIKILGLSLGLAVIFFILIFVNSETSYNKYNTNCDNLFRIVNNDNIHNWHIANLPYPMGDFIRETYKDIEYVSNLYLIKDFTFKKSGETIKAKDLYCVNSDFGKMFTINSIYGSFPDFDNKPFAIAISKSSALKYFGKTDIINETLTIANGGKDYLFTIKMVFEDFPKTSTLEPSFIGSSEFSLINVTNKFKWTDGKKRSLEFYKTNWNANVNETYVMLKDLKRKDYLEAQLTKDTKDFFKNLTDNNYYFQNIKNIYLNSEEIIASGKRGNKQSVIILSIVTILVLLIANINYIILSTSQITSRIKEFSIRKITGANKAHLFKQISIESLLVIAITIPLSFILIEQFRPLLSRIFEKEITLIYNYKLLLGFLAILCFVVFVPGLSVLVYLIKIPPTRSLQKISGNKFSLSTKVAKSLIAFQYLIFITLLVFSIGIKRQINYATSSDLGFNPANKLHIDLWNYNKYILLKEQLSNDPNIKNISGAIWLPPTLGKMSMNLGKDSLTGKPINVEALYVDKDFIETFDLELIEGKSFNDLQTNSEGKIILTETAQKKLGKDFISHKSLFKNNTIGVVKDFRLHSVHEKTKPLILIVNNQIIREMVIEYNTPITRTTISNLKEKIIEIAPEFNQDIQILNDRFDILYKEESRLAYLITLFTFVAIFIASIGLLGITIFTTKKQTKNIAIRKVNGASIFSIWQLLVGKYVILILIASTIAIPIGYYILRKWLQGFAYRSSIEWWIFAVSCLLALIISLLVITWYSLKAARKNPIESLRYE